MKEEDKLGVALAKEACPVVCIIIFCIFVVLIQ